MTDFDDKIQAAEEKAARQVAYANKLRIVRTAEAEIPSIWDTGQVTITGLAKTYGISQVTVKRILKTHGRVIKRMRKLSDEERSQVAALLQQGHLPEALASKYGVSKNTIRRIGIEEGVFVKGQRRPRRSDAEYDVIREFDAEARSRFDGAGLYNLGLGLKSYDAKKKSEAAALINASQGQPEARPEPPHTEADPEPGYDPPEVYQGPEANPEPEPVTETTAPQEGEPNYNF